MLYDAVAIGKRIADERKKNGMTQEEMAEKLNISTSTLGRIERGCQVTSAEQMIYIAVFLNISTDYLFFGTIMSTAQVIGGIQDAINILLELNDKLKNPSSDAE